VIECRSGHWCLDGSIVSPISICFAAISDKGSSYTSPYILLEYEVGAKRIVESMESSRDRVEVRTFLCAMLNNVGNLNSLGSVAKQYCSGIVLCLSHPQTSIPLSSRNPKEPVTAATRKLRVKPSNLTRYSRADRSVHLFLLTSQVDDRVIDLIPGVFMRQMKIHIPGIGPVFWARNEG